MGAYLKGGEAPEDKSLLAEHPKLGHIRVLSTLNRIVLPAGQAF